MSFYSSSSYLSTSNSSYSYFNSINSLSNSSYYNDIYRSYSNLRSVPKSYSTYLPLGYSSLKRPSYLDTKRTSDYYSKTPTGSSIKLESQPLSNSSMTNIKIEESSKKSSYEDFPKLTRSESVESLVKEDSIVEIIKQNETNDLAASAVSNIQLNLTDDLTTQVDYYINEVDNRMICSGKQVELESYELSSKSGLISKCIYVNELLLDAKMSESNLESDPVFTQNGKTVLLFSSTKDVEDFSQRHSGKFSVSYKNIAEYDLCKLKSQKKNVSFIENNNYSLNISENDECENDKKSILKNSNIGNRFSNTSTTSSSQNKQSDRTMQSFPNTSNNKSSSNENNDDNNLLISANSSKKNKIEGYEILTIRAKLKQRVGQNRTKHVTLSDIDSIMRNVVTIIQDEFMKRFPSGPSTTAPNGEENTISKNLN